MSSMFVAGVILAIISLISGYLISLLSKSSNNHRKLPPGKTGWPLIGESLCFASNPAKFVRDRMIKYSPIVFKTSIAGQPVAVLCGPAGNKFSFSNDNKLMKPWWPKALSGLLFTSDGNSSSLPWHDHSFLRVDSLRQHVPAMDSIIQDHLEKYWVPYENVKVHNLAEQLTFALTCRLFIDCDDAQVKDLAKPFFAITKGLLTAPINIPGTTFYAAKRASKIIRKKICAIIQSRKAELSGKEGSSDLLTKFLMATDENGRLYSLEEIFNKIIGYLIGSFASTSNAITFVLTHIADHPHVYDKILEEHQEIAKSKEAGELLTWEDIQKMKYTWNVVCESTRLEPTSIAFKEVLTEFTYSGFTIPKGWKVVWTQHSTNKDPNYFPNPENFDPSRFEGNGIQPYTFVPFGGGPNMCPGKEYVRFTILVFLHNAVTRFKWKKMNPSEKIIRGVLSTPSEGLPVHLQLHKK